MSNPRSPGMARRAAHTIRTTRTRSTVVTALAEHRRRPAPDDHLCTCGSYRDTCPAVAAAVRDLSELPFR